MYYISTADLRTPKGGFKNVPIETHVKTDASVYHSDVVFGSPKDDCRGAGICKIISRAENSTGKRQCNRTRALVQWLPEASALRVHFVKSDLCAQLVKHYFRHEKLVIKEPFLISPLLASVLGITSCTVPAGVYPIAQEGGGYTLVLPVE